MSFKHPATYKAAQISVKGGPFEIVDVLWKEPAAAHVVVKTLACGVCHSDSTVVQQHMPTGLPRVPGHELIGDIVAVGPGETRWKVGDRVGSGWHGGHCHNCKSCLKGDFVTCTSQNVNGIMTDGGYAEFCTLRSEACLSIPTDVDPAEAAPLLCAGVTTFNSLRNMDIRAGEIVAVQGVGGLGHLALQFSRAMGYRTIALSGSDSKEVLAKELGAHNFLDSSKVNVTEELQKLGGAKVIICVAPSGKSMSDLLGGLAVGGQLLVLAIAEPLSIPIYQDLRAELIANADTSNGIVTEEIIKFHLVPDLRKAFNKWAKENGCTAKSRQLTREEQDKINKTRKSLMYWTFLTVTPAAQAAYLSKHPNAKASAAPPTPAAAAGPAPKVTPAAKKKG